MMRRDERGRPGQLSDPRYRAILAELEDAEGPFHVEELAERLVERDAPVIDADEYDRLHERRLISLHHDALPRLADSGVVEYDADAKTVSYPSDQLSAVEWLDGDSIDRALEAALTGTPPEGDSIGVIQGRRAIMEYGRALADDAEEELFCMYVSPALLEGECLRRAADAINRGVAMYVGTRDEAVRDLTREHLPDATIWEPQRGLLTAPSGYPKVGRLVVVDRRTVMLALLAEPDADGRHPEETALVGEGEDNPLVVLVRDLLGSRLDHLDFQSETFRSKLHS